MTDTRTELERYKLQHFANNFNNVESVQFGLNSYYKQSFTSSVKYSPYGEDFSLFYQFPINWEEKVFNYPAGAYQLLSTFKYFNSESLLPRKLAIGFKNALSDIKCTTVDGVLYKMFQININFTPGEFVKIKVGRKDPITCYCGSGMLLDENKNPLVILFEKIKLKLYGTNHGFHICMYEPVLKVDKSVFSTNNNLCKCIIRKLIGAYTNGMLVDKFNCFIREKLDGAYVIACSANHNSSYRQFPSVSCIIEDLSSYMVKTNPNIGPSSGEELNKLGERYAGYFVPNFFRVV